MEGQPRRPRKVVYYFPAKFYFQDLFRRPDLVPYMDSFKSPQSFPSGSVRRSKRWHTKVTNNENMNGDRRNAAIIANSDGVPLFKDNGCRSGWPLFIRNACLADDLWQEQTLCHMVGYTPSDHLTYNEKTKTTEVTKE